MHHLLTRSAAVVTVILLAACGDDGTATSTTTAIDKSTSSTTATTTPEPAGALIEVEYAGGSVVGGAQRSSVPLGETVTIRITSDVAEEIHVHGYDITLEFAQGPAELTFVADIPGVFEVELEGSHKKLLDLEVA